MSETSSKSYVVKARKDKILNYTKMGHLRCNPTRRNPRADEKNQNATKKMEQMFDYFIILTGTETVKGVEIDVIKGARFKPIDGIEITGYISDVEVSKAS